MPNCTTATSSATVDNSFCNACSRIAIVNGRCSSANMLDALKFGLLKQLQHIACIIYRFLCEFSTFRAHASSYPMEPIILFQAFTHINTQAISPFVTQKSRVHLKRPALLLIGQ